jgi:hypothetical protein
VRKPVDKQKEVTAASFKRIAKQLRSFDKPLPMIYRELARVFDDEAKRLRAMR